MIANYESGTSPACAPKVCLHGEACGIAWYQCAQLQSGNELLGICFESACLIARISDPKKRAYMAQAGADAWPDCLPDGWFDEGEWLEACHVVRRKVAVA